ncbi:MAG TPA: glycosyltransferase family 4 protein [Firmicutes bacterium]|nr:glycosyltransferase family 4 protein [Bacillota bacterium]
MYILPFAGIGGTERHVLALVRNLKQRHRLCVLSPRGPGADMFRSEGVGFYEIMALEFDRNFFAAVASLRSRLDQAIRESGVSLIHVHANIGLALLSRLMTRRHRPAGHRLPLVFTAHGAHEASATLEYYIDCRLANRVADAVICVSGAEAARFRDLGIIPSKLHLIYNGIDEPRWNLSAGQLRSRYGIAREAVVIGTVARLERVKGVDLLLRAFAEAAGDTVYGHRNIVLAIIGSGSEECELRALARALGVADRVLFMGMIPEASACLPMFDIFVVPSRHEAFPLACLEAMAAGKAVIATRVGGIPEAVVDGETGILVESEDVPGLARALRGLVADPDRRRALGAAGRARYEKMFRGSDMAARTEGVYFHVLAGRDSGKGEPAGERSGKDPGDRKIELPGEPEIGRYVTT